MTNRFWTAIWVGGIGEAFALVLLNAGRDPGVGGEVFNSAGWSGLILGLACFLLLVFGAAGLAVTVAFEERDAWLARQAESADQGQEA